MTDRNGSNCLDSSLVQNLPDVQLSRNEKMELGQRVPVLFFFKTARPRPLSFTLRKQSAFIVSSAIIIASGNDDRWHPRYYSACTYCLFPYLIVLTSRLA